MNPSLLRQSAVRMGTLLRAQLGAEFGEKLLELVDDRLAVAATIRWPARLATAADLVTLLGRLARERGPEAAAAVAHNLYAAAQRADVDALIAVEGAARRWLAAGAQHADTSPL